MNENISDAVTLFIGGLFTFFTAGYFIYLCGWIIPRRVRSTEYRASLGCLCFCLWSSFVFVELIGSADLADQGRHTHIAKTLWDVGTPLLGADFCCFVFGLMAAFGGWIAGRSKPPA